MNRTPDEASRTRCCGPDHAGVPDENGTGVVCAGTSCMGWRWSEAKRTSAYLDAVQAEMAKSKADFNKASQVVMREQRQNFVHVEGYCGLAGLERSE